MVYPKPLQKGDKVAVICLSSGVIGEPFCAHERELGEKKLREFGLEPVFTEHALIYKSPEKHRRENCSYLSVLFRIRCV